MSFFWRFLCKVGTFYKFRSSDLVNNFRNFRNFREVLNTEAIESKFRTLKLLRAIFPSEDTIKNFSIVPT